MRESALRCWRRAAAADIGEREGKGTPNKLEIGVGFGVFKRET